MGRNPWQDKDAHCEYLDSIAMSLKSNLQFLLQTLDALLILGHNQANIALGEYQVAIGPQYHHTHYFHWKESEI